MSSYNVYVCLAGGRYYGRASVADQQIRLDGCLSSRGSQSV